MEFTLLAAALTAGIALWLGVRYQLRHHGYVHAEKPFDILLGAAGIGVFTGRLAQMLLSGVNPLANPFDILLVRAGVNTAVASIAAIATVVWVYRDDLGVLDVIAPAALFGLAGWHAGCVWTGSCLGTATGSDWGFRLPGSSVARHPTELYAAVGMAVLAYAVSRSQRRFVAVGLSLAAAGVVRAATQPVRPSLTGGPMGAYFAAAGVGVLVAGWTRVKAA